MGGGRWDPGAWSGYSTAKSYSTKSTAEIFSSTSLAKELDPKGAKRESCDSTDNPKSTPLIVALDVSGSMHFVVDAMARKGLNTLCTEVYERKPITDPHIMCMAIDDAEVGDQVPLQATQFEADIRIAEQLEKLFLEGGGGGNHYESYALAWYFAARHTTIDSFTKRNKKGYLFTVGDEGPTPYLRAKDIERVLGDTVPADIQALELLTEVSRQWEVFHIVVEEGDYAKANPDVRKRWADLLGQRVISLKDHTKMGEVIVSTLQINEGADNAKVAASWTDPGTAAIVRAATDALAKGGADAGGIRSL